MILLVEDEEDDVYFMERAMKKTGASLPMTLVRNGQEAMDYLKGAGQYANRARFPMPDLIFLDLKLPFGTGMDVLRWIRSREELKKIFVVVLTGSPEEEDRLQTLQLGADLYQVKPANADVLRQIFAARAKSRPQRPD